jgi:outer membrane protein insertion porin family
LTDRFFLGEPQIRGFDIRGVGPRVIRKTLTDTNGDGVVNGQDTLSTDRNQWVDDAIGGRYYYLGRAELEIPLGSGAKELGLRPSIFADMGAVWGVRKPNLVNDGATTYQYIQTCGTTSTTITNTSGSTPVPGAGCTVAFAQAFEEFYYGNSPKPRLSVGIGVNWNSPFGPFRIDVAKALLKQPGDDPKLFTFNVGTQF